MGKKRFFVKSLHKMATPPRLPFMKSLFIFFSTKKKDYVEGCLKGVFTSECQKKLGWRSIWKNKLEVWNPSDPPQPPPFTKWFHKKSFFFTIDGFPNCYLYFINIFKYAFWIIFMWSYSTLLYYISQVIWVSKYSTGWWPPICGCRIEMDLPRLKYTKLDPVFCKKGVVYMFKG